MIDGVKKCRWRREEVKEQPGVSDAYGQTICTSAAAEQSALDFSVCV